MSKLKLCIFAAVIALCYGNEAVETTANNDTGVANDQITIIETYTNTDLYNTYESNELWRKNDKIIVNYRIIFDNIASTVTDSSNQQRRAFSITISGILIYLASNGDKSMTLDLSEPADVISSDLRTVIIQMEDVLNPMVEETKRLCRPKTRQEVCDRRVNSFIREQEQQCKGFSEHVRFWRSTLEIFNDKDYLRFLCDVRQTSEKVQDDSETIAYLKELTEGRKHQEALRKLKLWFESYSSGNYPCNLPPVKCETMVSQKPQQQQVIYIIKQKYKKHHRHHHKYDSSSEEHHHKHGSSSEEHHHYHHHDEENEEQ